MDHVATDDVEFTHRFVATSDTRRKCALAFVRHVHRTRTTWVLYSALLMPFTVLIFSGMDERFSLESRLVWALIFAFAPTLVVAGCFAALGYVRTLRGARFRLYDGAVLESGFGDGAMVLRNPLSTARIRYEGIQSVTARGNVVFMRQQGVPLLGVYPRELFPDEAIERIRGAHRSR